MASPGGQVRQAIRSILADSATGFNAKLAAALAAQSIKPFQVDFAAGSTSFFQGYISPDAEEIDYSQISPQPLALVLYTTGWVNAKTTNAPVFSGLVEARIDAYVRLRARNEESQGVEADDTDSVMDCIEDAVMTCLNVAEAAWGSVIYNNDIACDRSQIVSYEDGYEQRATMRISCEVRI